MTETDVMIDVVDALTMHRWAEIPDVVQDWGADQLSDLRCILEDEAAYQAQRYEELDEQLEQMIEARMDAHEAKAALQPV